MKGRQQSAGIVHTAAFSSAASQSWPRSVRGGGNTDFMLIRGQQPAFHLGNQLSTPSAAEKSSHSRFASLTSLEHPCAFCPRDLTFKSKETVAAQIALTPATHKLVDT